MMTVMTSVTLATLVRHVACVSGLLQSDSTIKNNL